MATISTVIITYNEEFNIGRCIDSVKPIADEVIVVDSYSSDRTEEISRAKGAFFYKKEFKGFSDQKNYAISLAGCDYILSLDADEYLSTELTQSLLAIKQNMNGASYTMNRRSSYAGDWIRTCGWYPDTKLRLWKKENGVWKGQGVHEVVTLIYDLSVTYLKGDILHRAYDNIDDFLEKIQRYSSIYAQEWSCKVPSSGFKIFYKTIFSFFSSYFLHRGLFDGYNGFLISVCNANHTFYKYAKLKEMNNRLRVTLIIPIYNREEALELILLHVLKQSEWPKEVIIAGGSEEKTKKIIDEYRQKIPVPIIHCGTENLEVNTAAIRNEAIAMAQYECIIIVDEGVVLNPDFVKNYKKNAKKSLLNAPESI